MSLKNLSDDEILVFHQDPIAFLKVDSNYNSVFGSSSPELDKRMSATRRNLGQSKVSFAYNVEETK